MYPFLLKDMPAFDLTHSPSFERLHYHGIAKLQRPLLHSTVVPGNVEIIVEGLSEVICDCDVKWLKEEEWKKMDVTCDAPRRHKGRKLEQVRTQDLSRPGEGGC